MERAICFFFINICIATILVIYWFHLVEMVMMCNSVLTATKCPSGLEPDWNGIEWQLSKCTERELNLVCINSTPRRQLLQKCFVVIYSRASCWSFEEQKWASLMVSLVESHHHQWPVTSDWQLYQKHEMSWKQLFKHICFYIIFTENFSSSHEFDITVSHWHWANIFLVQSSTVYWFFSSQLFLYKF